MKAGLKRARGVIDCAMVVLLPILMAYSLAGEFLHEILGTLMAVLFIAHHILNRKAAAAMFRGRQTADRIFGTAVNILLFAVFVLLPLSGIVLSRYLYAFLPLGGLYSAARVVHMLSSYYGFLLMSLHLGLHFDRMLFPLKKHKKALIAVYSILGAIGFYGVYAFYKRRFLDFLTLKNQFVFFDFSESKILFFADYLAIMVLWALVGCILKKLLKWNR